MQKKTITVMIAAGLCLINSTQVPADCPMAYLTGDFFVDFEDFALMAAQWLTGNSNIPDDMVYIPGGGLKRETITLMASWMNGPSTRYERCRIDSIRRQISPLRFGRNDTFLGFSACAKTDFAKSTTEKIEPETELSLKLCRGYANNSWFKIKRRMI